MDYPRGSEISDALMVTSYSVVLQQYESLWCYTERHGGGADSPGRVFGLIRMPLPLEAIGQRQQIYGGGTNSCQEP